MLPKVKPDTISGSLTQETDLKLTGNDLDNLFESSDDDDVVSVLAKRKACLLLLRSC